MNFSIFEQISRVQILIVVLLALLFGYGLFFLYQWIKKDQHLRKVRKIVKKISCDFFKDKTLDLGGEQYAFFDYLILSKQGIVALEIKNFSGHIFASADINEWTQVIGHKSYKFINPFFVLEQKIEVLRQILPKQKMSGIILFNEQADFPKGRPDNVIRADELPGLFAKVSKKDISASCLADWKCLKSYLT